ncbi:hypothetical protein A3D00_02220 [Candidatus Woesebacteria bacterium RIFCSPHIGHO2_02_FULL_38_9]|uniref:Glycosyltransferase RgtA/B/C/D-like domain-containing protein n=1 Tax=Candidatus Woesebacteria bacterium RIFCSPHIGHO2_01_FULL_39_28 TaxID=1802496 RepID=A0A1F7YEZ5_9BACT|nr:MAG: hypothetical protein A2627_02160 [Candidatus Woesebacteria bacterium RIFCSPHIGHO2_01_FULL_39_28]OGM32780.1 MAG: hypothetical protein A3D00_02220 [Candidatus Woesebacteria bacterium RIFCSPHIGHO2_02_FULL_38_9]OGM58139.1 MAG: hypothetical protein A3A50_00040 [Candidatus Woesebacteria bacterium RIFCSPLOWO2_01_FULL_38_20]
MAKIITLFSLIIILLIGDRLRAFSYSTVPSPGESADEYSFAWVGLSLIEDHYPIAWSGLPAYKEHDYQKINVDGLFNLDPYRPPFAIDKPWFDHPPFFGLITGGYSYLKGARDFIDARTFLIRRPMLKIGILTTVLIFILGYKLYGSKTGLLAALLYSTIPTAVVSSRLALSENGYIPLFLSALIFFIYYLEKKKNYYWILCLVTSSIAFFFKLSAVSIFISLTLLALYYGKEQKVWMIKTLVLFFLGCVFLWVVYGVYYDWGTFIKVLSANSNRFYGGGAEVLFQAISQFKITTTKYLTDGWILLGWLSLVLVSVTEFKKSLGGNILTIASFSYLIIFIILGSESYGWYKFPFYPFLFISIARMLYRLFSEKNIFVLLVFVLLPIGTSVHRLIGVEGFQQYVAIFRLCAVFVFGIFILNLRKRGKGVQLLSEIFMFLIFAFAIFFSIKEILFITAEKWISVT